MTIFVVGGLVTAVILLVAVDLVPLIREKQGPEVALFLLLIGLSLLVGLVIILPEEPTSGYQMLFGAKKLLLSFF